MVMDREVPIQNYGSESDQEKMDIQGGLDCDGVEVLGGTTETISTNDSTLNENWSLARNIIEVLDSESEQETTQNFGTVNTNALSEDSQNYGEDKHYENLLKNLDVEDISIMNNIITTHYPNLPDNKDDAFLFLHELYMRQVGFGTEFFVDLMLDYEAKEIIKRDDDNIVQKIIKTAKNIEHLKEYFEEKMFKNYFGMSEEEEDTEDDDQ